MAQFRIEIAGHCFEVTSLFESTRDYCRNYLSEKAPDFSVSVTAEDLIFEQAALDEEAREEGMKRRKFTDPFLERTAIQRKVAEALFDRDVLLLHGSAVAVDATGYLFTAACGTGKSTHTRYWREVFGHRAVMVNDDKPFLQITPAGIIMYGAPWSGKHGLDTNVAVPLKGICILERGAENRIFPLEAENALPMLLHQSQMPLDPAKQDAFCHLVKRLSESVSLWRMECTKDPRAAVIAWEAMSSRSL
jgi:hypothetical protein